MPGQPAEVVLRVANTGGTGNVTINGTYQGGIFVAQTLTLAPGETREIVLRTAGAIAAQFAGQTIEAVFSLDGGQQLRVPIQVSAPRPAAWRIELQSISTPVNVGQYGQAVLVVTNTGGETGTVSLDGQTVQNGVVQGSWR